MLCRICGQNTVQIDTVTCVKGHSHQGSVPFTLPMEDMPLYRCPNCGHVQTENSFDGTYYDNYACRENGNSLTYYAYTDSIYSERLKKLQSLNNGKSIFDIGCGIGDALLSAQKYYEQCVGIEPSFGECQIARERGLTVINSYFDDTVRLEKPFDAAMCNMVFEHMEDPVTALKRVHDLLTPPGVMLINIPDGEKIVDRGIYHQFLTEHINYFCYTSIAKMAMDCGFRIVEIERNEKLLELNVYLRREDSLSRISEIMAQHKAELENAVAGAGTVLVWGAGTKSGAYSVLLKSIPVSVVVDSDPGKKGKYVSGIDRPVETASRENILQSDVVIIIASSYNSEIIATLKAFGYTGKIVYFDHGQNTLHVIRLPME